MLALRLGLVTLCLCVSPILLSWAEDGVTSDKLVLGQVAVLEGPAAALGDGMRAGIQAYLDLVNAQGGIHGRRLELKSLDDGYEPARAQTAAATLINTEHVFALIGSVGTPTSEAILPLIQQHKLPFWAPFTGAEFLRTPVQKYVINLRAGYNQEMEKIVDYLITQKKKKRIACFYQNDSFGQSGLDGLKAALRKRELSVIATGNFARNTLEVEKGLELVAQGNPDAIVIVAPYLPASAFIKQALTMPSLKNALFCSISFVGAQPLLNALGTQGTGYITQVMPDFSDTQIPLVAEFHKAMTKSGTVAKINSISLEGFASAKLLVLALQRVQGEPTHEKLMAALENGVSFDLGGLSVTYTPDNHQGMKTVYLTELKDGKLTLLK